MNPKHIIIILLLLVCSGTASATTYTVCASGCDYTTIQAAVTAASAYDIIEVQAGTYIEKVSITTAHLTIKGAGMATTHVEAATDTDKVFDVDASHTNITGMDISQADGSLGAAIYLDGNYDYCNFSYNRIADCYDGIEVRGTGNEHNLVLNNTITNIGEVGILVRDSSNVNVTENYIHHAAYAIYMRDSTDCFVFGNWVKHNTGYGLWQLGTANNLTFYNNWAENCSRRGNGGTTGTAWHITKRSGTNIFGGNYLGGNYWDDYAGVDNNADGLGNTAIPYTNGGNITNGGDSNPLCTVAGGGSPTRNCALGDICVNQTHWWRDDAPINASSDPIMGAIGAATAHQTIYVFNGSYTENIRIESPLDYLTLRGESKEAVHVLPDNSAVEVFNASYVTHMNLTGFNFTHHPGTVYAVQFWHAPYFNLSFNNISANAAQGGCCQWSPYSMIRGNLMRNNYCRGFTITYGSNNTTIRDNIVEHNGGRGLPMSYWSNDCEYINNTVRYNGLLITYSHKSGMDNQKSNNTLYDANNVYGNYASRDHLIRVFSNNVTIRDPASIIGDALDFDIEDSDCGWKVENTDGQIFTESSGATAYAYPTNFSMHRENAIETFTVTLTPMTLLSTDDQVTVTSISYNNAMYTEKYNITADCADTSETVTYAVTVANSSHYYKCYVDGVYDRTIQATGNVVTWSYADGFTTSHALAILWGSSSQDNDITLGANQHGMLRKNVIAAETFSTIAAGIDHDRCYTWWDSTNDRWESYRVGYSYNADKSVPAHDSYFVLMDGTGTTISCSIATAETVAIPAGYYATYLRQTTAKTLTEILADMGANVDTLWAFNSTAGAWTDTGTYSVLPNQGLMVNSSVGFNWDGAVP